MRIHHLRSATFIIETGPYFILIDPMLGDKGSLPAFSYIRFKAKKNPLVDLPLNAQELLNKVTHCLITHSQTFGIKAFQHTDHLDQKGEDFLVQKQIPVYSFQNDVSYLSKYGINVQAGIDYWKEIEFLGGRLVAIPAHHGHGWISKLMANGCGFYIELPNEPSLYISGDTVLTHDVKNALLKFRPDIAVVAAGQAQMDVGQPILMSKNEVREFIELSPKYVIANHLEALNHCPVKRDEIKQILHEMNVVDRVQVPDDGQTLIYEN